MIPKELEGILVSTPDTLSGAIRFAGTRVPVQVLLDTLMSNRSLEDFLEGYPNVTREQALAVIKWEQKVSRMALGLEPAA
jgi:uncharacterized protein (DUF433 family)